MALTLGFASGRKRRRHFYDHRNDFPAVTTELEYETLADIFLGSVLGVDSLQCARKNGDAVRLNMVTNEFGIVTKNGYIRTYFKPSEPFLAGRTPLQYFNDECAK